MKGWKSAASALQFCPVDPRGRQGLRREEGEKEGKANLSGTLPSLGNTKNGLPQSGMVVLATIPKGKQGNCKRQQGNRA